MVNENIPFPAGNPLENSPHRVIKVHKGDGRELGRDGLPQERKIPL